MKFPSDLKVAGITLIYKKKDPQAKKNYRSVSVLPVFSKFFERLSKSAPYITDYLLEFLFGYRQSFSPQHALIR